MVKARFRVYLLCLLRFCHACCRCHLGGKIDTTNFNSKKPKNKQPATSQKNKRKFVGKLHGWQHWSSPLKLNPKQKVWELLKKEKKKWSYEVKQPLLSKWKSPKKVTGELKTFGTADLKHPLWHHCHWIDKLMLPGLGPNR